MRNAGERLPGDAASGDRDFGPLGGLPDQVHEFTRRRERAADTDGERLVRAASDGDTGRSRGRLAAALARLREHLPPRDRPTGG